MIRQIVLEGNGQPDQVGILVISGDMEDFQVARLGRRLLMLGLRRSIHGNEAGLRYSFTPMDFVATGLDYQTIRVPPASGAREEILRLKQAVDREVAMMATADPRVNRKAPGAPCERAPRWLWVVAALIGLALVVTTCRAEHFVGVI